MRVVTLLTLGGMATGGMAGLGAGQQRAQQSRTNFGFAEDYLDATLKSNRSKRSILTGNLTLGAMGANQSAKANAVGSAAETSAQKASLGNTGLASGTPFYKLDQDIRDRQQQVMEAQKASQIQMAMQKDEATAGMAQLGLAEAQARQQLMDAGADLAYTSSPVALALSAATGAFAGGQMANSVMAAGAQSKLLSENFLGANLFSPKGTAPVTGGLFGNKPVNSYSTGVTPSYLIPGTNQTFSQLWSEPWSPASKIQGRKASGYFGM